MLEGLKRSIAKEFNGLMMEDDLLKYNEKEFGELQRKIVVAAENNCKKTKKNNNNNNNIAYLQWQKIKMTKESKKEEGENRTGEKERGKEREEKCCIFQCYWLLVGETKIFRFTHATFRGSKTNLKQK